MKCLLSPSDLEKMTVEEINDALVKAFQYDDFQWQYDHRIAIKNKNRAVGLEKVLYQCPHCKAEYRMSTKGITLMCNACSKTWEMSEYGRLKASDGETEFEHIPSWYEWERENVKKEVTEGRYSTGVLPVTVKSLPNAKGYINLGSGTMIHDANGFKVEVTDRKGCVHTMEKSVPSLYSVHIEYEYLFKHGDAVDLNTLTDTWYIFPHDCDFSITKIALATEELYYNYRRRIGKPCKPGLA